MPALVPELVNMASDPAVSTTDLLRRALVVAHRLEVSELADWIKSELNGYTGEVPVHRIITGQLCAEDSYQRRVPFVIPPEISSFIPPIKLHQSIPELMGLAQSGHMLLSYFPAEIEKILMQMIGSGLRNEHRPVHQFSSMQVTGVIERVRSRILDWALDLEVRGIIGDGMSFTPEEKQTVQEMHFHISNVTGSQIQISSHGSNQTQANANTNPDIEDLRGLIEALGAVLERNTVQGIEVDELRAELATLSAQAASPKPKWEIIKATARSIKAVAEGAAGNLLGELARPHVQTLLALAAGATGS